MNHKLNRVLDKGRRAGIVQAQPLDWSMHGLGKGEEGFGDGRWSEVGLEARGRVLHSCRRVGVGGECTVNGFVASSGGEGAIVTGKSSSMC